MDSETALTGCRHTIIGNFHDLKSQPRIIKEPMDIRHPRGVDPATTAIETARLEHIVQEGIDQLNRGRLQDSWFDSQYYWNAQEQAWRRRPDAPAPKLIRRPLRFPHALRSKADNQADEGQQEEKADVRKVKSDNTLEQPEAKQPAVLRKVHTHQHALHHHRGHGHGHHAKHDQTKHTHGKRAQAHQHTPIHHRGNHNNKHGEKSQRQQHQSDVLQDTARPGRLPGQEPHEDYHPELDVLDELFPDDKSPRHKPVHTQQQRRPAQRPVLARAHASQGRLARHNAPRPQRPALRRAKAYMGDLPRRGTKHEKSGHHDKISTRGQVAPHHKAGKVGGGHHTVTFTQQEDSQSDRSRVAFEAEASARGDEETPHHEGEPNDSHVEDRQSPNPGDRLGSGYGKTPVPGKAQFMIGPGSHDSHESQSDASARSAEGDVVSNPQQPRTTEQSQEEERDEIKERLRRAIMAEDNEAAIVSSDEEDSEEIVDDDDNEDDETPKAQQQQQELPLPPSQSRAHRQEDVRQQLVRAITTNRDNKPVITEEEAAPTYATQNITTPTTPGEGCQPSSLLTQGLLAQRAAAAAAAAAADDVVAPATRPTHHHHDHDYDPYRSPRPQTRRSHHHQAAAVPPPPPLVPPLLPTTTITITTELPARAAAEAGLPPVVTTVVTDVREQLQAQRRITHKARQALAALGAMGRRTGFPLVRIEEEDAEEEAEEAAAAVAAAEAAEAAADPAGCHHHHHPPPPPRRARLLGHHLSEARNDYLRSQPVHLWGTAYNW